MQTITLPDGFTPPERKVRNTARRDWYRIADAKAEEAADVYIYDEIGYWGTTAQQFVKDLQAVKAGKINLHLNTPGGDVFDGIAIHNALRQHSAKVHVSVDSLAASIGSVIAMAGDRITMAKHSTMMIHDPFGFAMGNAADMRQMGEVLDKLGDTIAGVYAERAGGSVREWRDRMLEEMWLSDREAVDLGLADEVDGDEATAKASFDLSMFRHPPDNLAAQAAGEPPPKAAPTKREIEKALRDGGLSHTQSKALLASGWASIESAAESTRDAEDARRLLDAFTTLLAR